MPLDPSIISGIRPVQIDMAQFSPINTLMSAMKIKQLGQEGELNALRKDEYVRAREEQQQLRDYIGTSDMSTPEGRAGVYRYGDKGLAFGKALTERDTALLTQKKTDLDIRAKQVEFGDSLRRGLSSNPSDENVMLFGKQALAQGLYTPAEIDTTVKQLLAMPPEQRVSVLAQSGATARDLKPNQFMQSTGATNQLITGGNPFGGGSATVVPGSVANITSTPAQLEANRVANARLALEQQKFNYERANPGMELKEDADGNLFGINKRTLQVMPVNITGEGVPAVSGGIPSARAPAVQNALTPGAAVEPTSAPQQFKGKGTALTESQGNATAFGLRMKDSNAILEKLAKEGTLRGANIEATPFVGEQLGKVLPGFLGGTNAAQQQVNQAKTNFITAVLRKESGAAIGASEFATEDRKYFPQLNDDKKTIEQKANARKLAIKAMEIQAGPGAKQIQQYVPSSGANENDPLGLLGGR
jgi:hypothetical protein